MAKALITGGAGFIGGQLSRRLLAEGFEVDLVDNMSRGVEDDLIAEFRTHAGFSVHVADLRDPSSLTVRIGTENPDESLRMTSVVATGYGAGDQAVARLGVLGPTRMDYPGAMGAVRAVARYVGQILAEG